MTEVQVFVAPAGGGNLRFSRNFSNLYLSAFKLEGLIHSVDIVDTSASLNRLQVLSKVGVARSDRRGEFQAGVGHEAELPREDGGYNFTVLSFGGHFRKTHGLNEVSGSGKARLKRFKDEVLWGSDVVLEVVGEEV